MRDQIAEILRANSALATFIGDPDRIWTQPLIRPGSDDPLDQGFDETPEAFESVAPRWLKRNIVVGSRVERNQDRNRRTSDSLTARWGVSLAYYVPPDDEDALITISYLVSVALLADGSLIDLPNGRQSRIVIPHDITASVPVPEFIDAGFVMLERIEIPTIWAGSTLR